LHHKKSAAAKPTPIKALPLSITPADEGVATALLALVAVLLELEVELAYAASDEVAV
jgi:hypothetical protein